MGVGLGSRAAYVNQKYTRNVAHAKDVESEKALCGGVKKATSWAEYDDGSERCARCLERAAKLGITVGPGFTG